MKRYRFYSPSRGVFQLTEYVTVHALSLDEARAQVHKQFKLFSITK
jgi:hypothetical protein